MLTTARLRLRRFTAADIPRLLVLSAEDGIRRWIPDQVCRDADDATAVITALMAATAREPAPHVRPFVLGVEHLDSAALIGHVGLSPARGSVEIGYAIATAHQGHGFATEAVRAFASWGVTMLGLPEVLGIVAAANVASRRVLAKAGFTLAPTAPPAAAPATSSAASASLLVYQLCAADVSLA